MQVFFSDGTATQCIAVEYPLGHRRCRAQGILLLVQKFTRNLSTQFSTERCAAIYAACEDQQILEGMAVPV